MSIYEGKQTEFQLSNSRTFYHNFLSFYLSIFLYFYLSIFLSFFFIFLCIYYNVQHFLFNCGFFSKVTCAFLLQKLIKVSGFNTIFHNPHCCDQECKARKIYCGRVYSAYIPKPVLFGRNL